MLPNSVEMESIKINDGCQNLTFQWSPPGAHGRHPGWWLSLSERHLNACCYSPHIRLLYTPSRVHFAYIQQVVEFASIITNIKLPFFHIHIQYFLVLFFFLILAVRGNFINKWSCGIPSTIEWRDCQYVALKEVKMPLILEISSSETYILNLSSLLFPLPIIVFSPSYSPSCFSHLSLLAWKFWLSVGGKQ